jgi:hypothetical protein
MVNNSQRGNMDTRRMRMRIMKSRRSSMMRMEMRSPKRKSKPTSEPNRSSSSFKSTALKERNTITKRGKRERKEMEKGPRELTETKKEEKKEKLVETTTDKVAFYI